ncbi:Uncharacterized MFS-type transporter, partial [hydrothermal vent metagenome]
MSEIEPSTLEDQQPWYKVVTKYQWLVLLIASAGWIFDVYEGQIFNITSGSMFEEILRNDGIDHKENKVFYKDMFLGIFLLGGTVGGLWFGSLADKHGRRPIMMITILMYSIFSGLTYFADTLWHVAVLRFFVAMGVGGEWAIAASLVAEVFPKRFRAQASGIFHASSVLGTWLAAFVGILVGMNWRYAYLFGILPAILILVVRILIKEPEKWQTTKTESNALPAGSFSDLLGNKNWNKNAFLGMLLAAVGLATFWSVVVAGQGLAMQMLLAAGTKPAEASTSAKFAYGFIQTAGGGLGLLTFGPMAAKWGRKKVFFFFHLMAIIMVPIACYVPQTYQQLLFILPVFGFFTLGMHAGYAIYFPELFPTHLRATGTSFCFNGGRLLAVPLLFLSGYLKESHVLGLTTAVSLLSLLYLLGIVVILF